MYFSPLLDPSSVEDRRVIEFCHGIIEVSPDYPFVSKAADRAIRDRFPDIVSIEVDLNTLIVTVDGSMKERDNHVYISIHRWDRRTNIDYPLKKASKTSKTKEKTSKTKEKTVRPVRRGNAALHQLVRIIDNDYLMPVLDFYSLAAIKPGLVKNADLTRRCFEILSLLS